MQKKLFCLILLVTFCFTECTFKEKRVSLSWVMFGKQQVKLTLLVISHGRAKVRNLHFFADEFANATIWPFRPGCFEVWRIRLADFFLLSSKPTSKSWNLHAPHSRTRKIWMNKLYQAEKSGKIHWIHLFSKTTFLLQSLFIA